ncbi:MAG: LacI family DNA-binding transcriptional regulator [Lentisphaeria bacterium]|nr:LacI family DNA-binding transcriptional regulator [Lentisphaeria bacterium]
MAAGVTLKTIAERTGLSVPTVSQILNNRKNNYSSAETREKVLRVAKELHYRQNFGYQLLHGKKTGTVAMIASGGTFYNEQKRRMFQASLIGQLTKAGYNAYATMFSDDPGSNLDLVRDLLHRGVERVILHGHPVNAEEIFAELAHAEVNFIGNHDICPRYVGNGSVQGRKRILEYIISRVGEDFKIINPGWRISGDAGHIKPLRWQFPQVPLEELAERFVFKIAAPENAVNDDWMQGIAQSRQELYQCGYQAMEQLHRRGEMPAAVIFSNDTFAVGGGMWLLENGHEKYRNRVILAGYNNDAELNSFPLPIISGEDDITRQTQMLIERCGDKEPCTETVLPRVFFRKHSARNRFPAWDCEIEQL